MLCSIQELQTEVKDEKDHQQCTKNHSAQTQKQTRSLSKDDRNIRTATYKVNSESFIYLFIYSSFYACSYISYGS